MAQKALVNSGNGFVLDGDPGELLTGVLGREGVVEPQTPSTA